MILDYFVKNKLLRAWIPTLESQRQVDPYKFEAYVFHFTVKYFHENFIKII